MAKIASASAAMNPPAPQAPGGSVDAPPPTTPPADPAAGQSADSTDAPPSHPAPTLDLPPSPSEPILCRVNWRFDGFLGENRLEGDEVECTEADAAPYLGGVLSRID